MPGCRSLASDLNEHQRREQAALEIGNLGREGVVIRASVQLTQHWRYGIGRDRPIVEANPRENPQQGNGSGAGYQKQPRFA